MALAREYYNTTKKKTSFTEAVQTRETAAAVCIEAYLVPGTPGDWRRYRCTKQDLTRKPSNTVHIWCDTTSQQNWGGNGPASLLASCTISGLSKGQKRKNKHRFFSLIRLLIDAITLQEKKKNSSPPGL